MAKACSEMYFLDAALGNEVSHCDLVHLPQCLYIESFHQKIQLQRMRVYSYGEISQAASVYIF